MKKLVSLLCGILIMLSSSTIVNAATMCKTVGSQQKCGVTADVANRIYHLTDTNAYHNGVVTTTISAGVTRTITQSSSATIGVSGGISLAEVSATLGIGESVSYSNTAGVSYTLTSSTSAGYYRVSIAHPGSSYIHRTYTLDGALLSTDRSVSYAPKFNGPYRYLYKYA